MEPGDTARLLLLAPLKEHKVTSDTFDGGKTIGASGT